MSNQNDVVEIELDIERAKEFIKRKENFDKLCENPLFKEIIEDNYFRDEASRLVLFKANPSAQEPTEQYNIDRRIDSIGFLKQYFISIVAMGNMSKGKLDSYEREQEAMLAEDLDS